MSKIKIAFTDERKERRRRGKRGERHEAKATLARGKLLCYSNPVR